MSGGVTAGAFLTFGRWSAAVAGITGVELGFEGGEFGLFISFGFLMASFQTLVEVLELGRTILSQARADDAGEEQRDQDRLHFDLE